MKKLTMAVAALSLFIAFEGTAATKVTEVAPGVLKLQAGEPERFTPYAVLAGKPMTEAMAAMPEGTLPFRPEDVTIDISDRGCLVEVPLQDDEQIYGFGLQFETFGQRGMRKQPKVNDNPLNGLGYSHAPQTFYVSTKGYGILVNTSRYTTFLCGSNQRHNSGRQEQTRSNIATTTDELYANRSNGNKLFVDIPGAKGAEVFVFKGPQLVDAVKRYNLLSGGGALPPMWGLGFKYRVKGDAPQDSVMRFANYFRDKQIPCDVLGLEPGWQTAAYSCSYKWSDDRFPNHRAMLDSLRADGYHVNLWEHAYVNPSSPIREQLEPYAGDFLVWNGLVPDFLLPEARNIFAGYHGTLADEGVSGFKLDECDNSNIAYASATWCFPDISRFPSGIDGEQMHQLFGSLYVNTMDSIYRSRNLRTYNDYRSSGVFMSPRNAVLYSDTYDAKEYIQALCNAAFGGLLWCPEVREAASAQDFFHRLQVALLSPQAMVNAWYLQYAPWLQFDRYKNERGEFLPQAEEYEGYARTLINGRMALVPYLYEAFRTYNTTGLPPFRPLIMDYPDNKKVRDISDQYMIGPSLMAAPLYRNGNSRKVYLPEGTWYDFNTNARYEGGTEYEITTALDQLPLFVKEGTLLPLAEPVQCITPQTVFNLHCKVYSTDKAECTLFEDDGETYDYTRGNFNTVTLRADKGKVKLTRTKGTPARRYRVASAEFIK